MNDTIVHLVDRVHELGLTLARLGPNRLHVFGPRDAMTPELRDELTAHKAELLEHLRPHPCTSCGRHVFPLPGVTCYWCRRGREQQPAEGSV